MYVGFVRISVGLLFVFNLISCAFLFKTENAENIVRLVNGIRNNTWKAGFNFKGRNLMNVSRLMGVLNKKKLTSNDFLPTIDFPAVINRDFLPESYNVMSSWSGCKSVVSIRDQSNCGSCWALATSSAFGDRMCIASNTSINKIYSGEYINSCCTKSCGNGCNGGHPEKAWKFIKKNGVCTGGEYDSNEGCQPYSIPPSPRRQSNYYLKENQATPPCYKDQCTNSNYSIPLPSDLSYATKIYSVKPNANAIMYDIYTKGPVVAAMKVYDDFVYYKSGIYQYTVGGLQGDHAVKLLGWGQDDGIDYWLCANTWSTSWGMDGFFKIRRGKNECEIENRITGGLPKIVNSK